MGFLLQLGDLADMRKHKCPGHQARDRLLAQALGKHRMHTSLVSKRIYLKRRLLEQMKWKEEMKVRSTNVESAPPRKKKFATLTHQLVSLSMKFSAQKREKKDQNKLFQALQVLYI